MKIEVVLVAAFICVAVTGGGSAGEADESTVEPSKPERFIGGGAVISAKPYEGVDSKVYPVPMFGYEGERLYIRGIGAGYRIFRKGGWSLGPVVRPRFDGYRASDSRALAGMKDRDLTVYGGVALGWLTGRGLIGANWVTDLLGRHSGQELEVSYTARFSLAGFDLIPSVGLSYKSNRLVDYYYGVRASEARDGRPAYKGGAATDPFVRLVARRKLVGQWELLGTVQCEWFDREIINSPIVDKAQSVSFVGGVLYSF